VFASQLHILFSDRVALRFSTRKIEFDQNQILCGVVLELWFGKNFGLHPLAIAAPIRAGKIEQDKLVVRFRFRLGCIEISQPVNFGKGEAGGNESYATEEEQFLHVTSFRQRSGDRKSVV